jgi:hypothetical protein
MRWQQLFADLAAQFEEAEATAERAELPSRARTEHGAVRLDQRLRGAVGATVVVRCRGAGPVPGVLVDAGPDWLLVEDAGRESLIAGSAVLAVGGLGRRTAVTAGEVLARWDLRRAVRALARDRSAVQVVLVDGGLLTGTVDRVGADFLEVAEHPLEDARRAAAVRGVTAVPLDAVALIRTA